MNARKQGVCPGIQLLPIMLDLSRGADAALLVIGELFKCPKDERYGKVYAAHWVGLGLVVSYGGDLQQHHKFWQAR